jgi:menaquinone-dependent protoporphyrinogen oxidase
MDINTLYIYSTVDGQTLKISRVIRDVLQQRAHKVDFVDIDEWKGSLEAYDKIIIASRIRYGTHNGKVKKLIDRHAGLLNAKKAVFISVNLVARKPAKNTPETNPLVAGYLNSIRWKPKLTGVFAGTLDYSKYGYIDKSLIKLIMTITKGPVHAPEAIEYTDWDKVREFAVQISEL